MTAISRVTAAGAAFALGVLLLPPTAQPRAQAQTGGEQAPGITITHVPKAGAGSGSRGMIAGRVSGVEPKTVRVVIYSYTNTWYVQPLIDRPFTKVAKSGKWSNTIHLGYQYGALLVTTGYQAPAELDVLPAVGGDVLAVASVDARRKISFAGYDWSVKISAGPVGPGPNYFSDSDESVQVDAAGQLHLAIRRVRGTWLCAEILCDESLGYGTYQFYLNSPVDNLDPNVVLGLFSWSDDPVENNREMDIEFTRGPLPPDGNNAQYVVQPYTVPGNLFRFLIPAGIPQSVHSFGWEPGRVSFTSVAGTDPNITNPVDLLQAHTFTSGVPDPTGASIHMNLWLWNGQAPTNGQPVEVVISNFGFLPDGS